MRKVYKNFIEKVKLELDLEDQIRKQKGAFQWGWKRKSHVRQKKIQVLFHLVTENCTVCLLLTPSTLPGIERMGIEHIPYHTNLFD